MQQTRSLCALFALLATIFIATSCVDAAGLSSRQTNADRLRRNLGPLPPVKRKPSGILTARQTTTSATATTGRAAIVAADGTVLGHLSADDPSLVDASSTTRRRNLFARTSDVVLHFVEGTGKGNGSLLAQNALYTPPYIGQSNKTLSGQKLFTNVAEGALSTMWSLNSTTGALTAQWTNPNGSLPKTYILYNKTSSRLSFSSKKNVTGMVGVTLSLST
ncbi:uncharacterized protein STEHIDRAFT_159342 [Stereum hirsutum FP-91666 SS1]|uniref:uncharacterized protein n=1 Tax=Stereum hirsutum (strain FP-91666) TaxID=721885 RepID=UPI00044499F4|nr:uncharacterized protein STEHIDRAFT_159342 [Stereum hirsutum FP-91666 SS1]EIM83717.1 hypothetical protein STEHIDRAFT_159342 [Stereum hirsutum FP-91666 SS1]